MFFAVNTAGVLIRIPILHYASRPCCNSSRKHLPPQGHISRRIHRPRTSPWPLAVGIVMMWNFFINRYWTYNDIDDET
jgi:hypothetical protein